MALKQWLVGLAVVAVLASLAGLVRGGDAGARPEAALPALERSVAAAAARARADLPIAPRILQVGSNQVQVIDIPSMVTSRSTMVATRRCYVWRDLEFKTSSITCPEDGEVQPMSGPPPSNER